MNKQETLVIFQPDGSLQQRRQRMHHRMVTGIHDHDPVTETILPAERVILPLSFIHRLHHWPDRNHIDPFPVRMETTANMLFHITIQHDYPVRMAKYIISPLLDCPRHRRTLFHIFGHYGEFRLQIHRPIDKMHLFHPCNPDPDIRKQRRTGQTNHHIARFAADEK